MSSHAGNLFAANRRYRSQSLPFTIVARFLLFPSLYQNMTVGMGGLGWKGGLWEMTEGKKTERGVKNKQRESTPR